MRKSYFIVLAFFLSFTTFSSAHVNHYKNIKYLKYDLLFNGDFIGSHEFNFQKNANLLIVNGSGAFKVNKFGVELMNFQTKSQEVYQNDQLIQFTSETIQNDKKKHVNLKLKKGKNVFDIDGSSFKGQAKSKAIIGTWWNHEIIKKKEQISAVSGKIIPQKVRFLGKKKIELNNNEYNSLHLHFLSNDNKPIKKKKINLHVWYDEKTLIWLKMSYEKLGKWEYRLKEMIFY